MTRLPLAIVLLVAATGHSAEAAAPCPIFPPPQTYNDTGRTRRLDGDKAAIVLGEKATLPERYAAERLQGLIQRRYSAKIPTFPASQVPPGAKQLILLGQPGTHAMLEQVCRNHNINLGQDASGGDAFCIQCVEDDGRQLVVVAGSNPRSVIYGQDALFDLLRPSKSGLQIPVASVRDQARIAWRGRPHSVLEHHLVPGAMDAYVRARINFTDVRDDQRVKAGPVFPARKASMGLPPGLPLDRPKIQRVIDEAHRRGMFVYGTVSCAVDAAKHADVIRTFEELIAMGVDGLWMSFDDTGAGSDPEKLAASVLQLGRRHGMTGEKIAITPPAGSYEHIDRPFNRSLAAVPGMAEAQWLFTRVPCAADVTTAREVGIRRLPGWWHNLVDVSGGFLHTAEVLCTTRADDRPGYLVPQPLGSGWHRPKYEQLRSAEQCTQCALLWGVCNGWPEEYEVGALGLWAWNPAAHDWAAFRRAAYRYLYGPELVATATEFDDRLTELEGLFAMRASLRDPRGSWPCRLKKVEDRAKALALVEQLRPLAARLSAEAPRQSAIEQARLERVYLEPMRASLDYASRMARLDYPEYVAADYEASMFELLDADQTSAAAALLEKHAPRIRPALAQVEKELAGLKGIDDYLARWRQRTTSLEAWQKLAGQRRREMQARLAKLLASPPAVLFPYKSEATSDDLRRLLEPVATPPEAKAIQTFSAERWLAEKPRWRGLYAVGPFRSAQGTLAAVGYPPNVPSNVGDYGELRQEIQVPDFRGRLLADVFITDTRLDNRYRGYRQLELRMGDRLAWKEDVATNQSGREWITVDITADARKSKTLTLGFRSIEIRPVGGHASVVFLGPVRLREAE